MIAHTTFRLASALLLGGLLLAVSSCDINDAAAATAGGSRTGSYAPRLVMADSSPIPPVDRIVAALLGSEQPRIQSIALWEAGAITLNGLPLDRDLLIRIEGWTADTLVWSGLRQVRLSADNPTTQANLDAFPVTYDFPVDPPTLASGVSRSFGESVQVRFTTRPGVVIRFETGSQALVTRLSPEYDPTDPPVLWATDTIQARAYRLGVPSPVATFVFVQDDAIGPSRPQLDPSVGSTFTTSLALKFVVPAGIQIFYTIDGSDPRASDTRRLYDPSQPETIWATTTVVATAFRTSDQKYSSTDEWGFEKVEAVVVGEPILAPGGGTVYLGDSIRIRTPSIGACSLIRYRTDGQSPVGPSAIYETYQNAIIIPPAWKDSTVTVIAACVDDDAVPGDTVKGVYQVRERTTPAELQATRLGTDWPVAGSGRQFLEVGKRKLAATDIGLYEFIESQGWRPAATWPAEVNSVIDLAATTTMVYALTSGGICKQDVEGVGSWDCQSGSFGMVVGPNRMQATNDGLLLTTDSLGMVSVDFAFEQWDFLPVYNASTSLGVPIQSLALLGEGATAYVGFEGNAGRLFIGDASSIRFITETGLPYLFMLPFSGVADAVSISPAPAEGLYAAFLGTESGVFGVAYDGVNGQWRLDMIGTSFASRNAVRDVVQVGGRLYAATQDGAYWHSATSTAGAWTKIANSPQQVNRISVFGTHLNLASRDGVWSVALP